MSGLQSSTNYFVRDTKDKVALKHGISPVLALAQNPGLCDGGNFCYLTLQ